MKALGVGGAVAALLVCGWAAAFAHAAYAQEAATVSEMAEAGEIQTGWHTVRPGENLIRITAKYLGTTARWRDNWRLNPEIQNPHVIQPGTRLRVILQFETAPPIARLKTLSGKVEARPVPIPWNEARVQDLLVEKDGLRTFRNSSTELEFQDGTDLVITEGSLVFVRPSRRTVVGPLKRSVEIVEGQAELQAVPTPGTRTDVEIVVGSATATPRRTEDGSAQTRARRGDDGSAQVMAYTGSTEVEASGESVDVPEGMGTAVPEDAPPLPPEELLAAPELEAPADGRRIGFGNPWFAWTAIDGAASYTVELCRDRDCSELHQRIANLEQSRWRPDRLPEGTIHWRATAVADSGLDGYPSASRQLDILSGDPDTTPPTGRIRLVGDSVVADGETYWSPAVRVEVEMRDGESGLAEWTARRDGHDVDEDALNAPWSSGRHEVQAWGLDQSGNRGETAPLEFVVDADGPQIDVRTGGRELLEEKLGAEAVPKWWGCRTKRWSRRHRARDGEGAAWTVLASGSEVAPLELALPVEDLLTREQLPDTSLAIDGDGPGALLFVAGDVESGEDAHESDAGGSSACSMERGTVVWIGAADAATGQVRSLRVEAAVGEPAITVGAVDGLANESAARLAASPRSR